MIRTMNGYAQRIFGRNGERRLEERRAQSEDSGAWEIVCNIWNKVAYRRHGGSERRIDSLESVNCR